MTELLKLAEEYGVMAVLVLFLVWQNAQRERRYMEFMEKVAPALEKLGVELTDTKNVVLDMSGKLQGHINKCLEFCVGKRRTADE